VPAGERDRVEQAKRNLRRERIERKDRIEDGEVSFEEGEELAEAIVGIDRALEALESLKPESVEAEAERQEAADTKRWMDFLRKALGHDDDGPQVRGP
jgi:Mn-dependent DtxR family transcriptional regulator